MWQVCRHCGERYRRKGRGPAPKYCSATCRAAAHRAAGYKNPPKVYVPQPLRSATCARCSANFEGHGGRLYCSATCRQRAAHEKRVADGRWAEQLDKRRKHEPRPCIDCGQALRIGQRCRDCARVYHRTLRRAGQLGIDVDSSARLAVFERDAWVCQLCDGPIDRELAWPDPMSKSIDHKVPLSRCRERFGPDYVDNATNWQAAHYGCNSSKGAHAAS